MVRAGNSAFSDQVFALTTFDGDVIAAGDFLSAGGATVNRIAHWDGQAWHPLGSGLNGNVRALAVLDGELYAGGFFTQAGGQSARGIARWNGSSWQGAGGGVTSSNGGPSAVFARTTP
ncbi:MAG TPA: hypothetical protein VK824_00160 [Planctomycetota bacterium]|nr:hypothetical protein [Planctomycetota bacterium]